MLEALKKVPVRFLDLLSKALGWDEAIAITFIIMYIKGIMSDKIILLIIVSATLTTRAIDKGLKMYKEIKGIK